MGAVDDLSGTPLSTMAIVFSTEQIEGLRDMAVALEQAVEDYEDAASDEAG